MFIESAISLELIIQCVLSKTKVTTVVISSSFPPFTNKDRSCQVNYLIHFENKQYLPPMFHCIPFCTFSGMECQLVTSNSRHQSWLVPPKTVVLPILKPHLQSSTCMWIVVTTTILGLIGLKFWIAFCRNSPVWISWWYAEPHTCINCQRGRLTR